MATPQETPEQAIERRLTLLEQSLLPKPSVSGGGLVGHIEGRDGAGNPTGIRAVWDGPQTPRVPVEPHMEPPVEAEVRELGTILAEVAMADVRPKGMDTIHKMWAKTLWDQIAARAFSYFASRPPLGPTPDLAEPTDEMLTSMATALREEWLLSPPAAGTPSYFRRLACRAFEHAPYLVPDRPGAEPAKGWRPISTIAECKTMDVVLTKEGADRGGSFATITDYEWAILHASSYGWRYWQPLESPSSPQ